MPEYTEHTLEGIREAFANAEAREGCDRCYCGCKYWENDHCIDCKTSISECLRDPEWVAENRSA